MALDAATELVNIIPEVWDPMYMKMRYHYGIIAPRCLNKDSVIAKYGDKVNMGVMSSMTVGDVTATSGAMSDTDFTVGAASITIDKWKYLKASFVDAAKIETIGDIVAPTVSQMIEQLLREQDNQLASLVTSGITSNSIGGPTESVSEERVLEAITEVVADNELELTRELQNLTFFLYTSLFKDLKQVEGWNYAAYSGESVGGMLKPTIPNMYGIPTYLTNLVPSSLGRRNWLQHREALGIANVAKPNIVPLAKTQLSTDIAAHAIFGVGVLREGFACQMITA